MPILVMCSNPACGELFDAPDGAADRVVHCPVCGTGQTVAGTPTAAPPKPKAEPAAPAAIVPAPAANAAAPATSAPAPPAKPPTGAPAPASAPRLAEEKPDLLDLDLLETSAPPPPRPRASSDDSAARPAAPAPARPPPPSAPREVPSRPARAAPPSPAGSHDVAERRKPKPKAPAGQEEIWGDLLDGAEEATPEAAAQTAPAVGALDSKPASVAMLVLSALGMAAGLAAGLLWYPGQPLLAAYVGAGLGWVAGFTFGVLLVLGMERADPKARCPACGEVYSPDTDTCRSCGSLIPAPGSDPLTAECLHAGSYALSNPRIVVLLVLLAIAGYLVAAITAELLWAFPKALESWSPLLIGLAALVGYVVLSYWTDYLLSVVAEALVRPPLPPEAPGGSTLGSLGTFTAGAQGLALLAVYVPLLVTIPLLPLALLRLASTSKGRAMNPAATARGAWRHAKAFVVLWLFLLMWLAAMALAVLLVVALYGLSHYLPTLPGFAGRAIDVMVSALLAAGLSLVAAVFGVALARCIGAFGRCNPGFAGAIARG